jgi:hypothetical protein
MQAAAMSETQPAKLAKAMLGSLPNILAPIYS